MCRINEPINRKLVFVYKLDVVIDDLVKLHSLRSNEEKVGRIGPMIAQNCVFVFVCLLTMMLGEGPSGDIVNILCELKNKEELC